MELPNKKMRTTLFTLIVLNILASDMRAALTVSNWNITSTTLSFDITGTIDQPFTGNRDQLDIFVGELNNSSWAISSFITGTIIDNGSSIAGTLVYAYVWNGSPDGDVAYLRYGPKWQTGNIFNYSLSYNGSFDPSAVEVQNLAVFWGLYSNRSLQPEIQIGTAIPELSSTLLIAIGTFLITSIRSRTNH
jgi:hypothetical protein